jgi:hypothetical protein
MDWLRQAVAAGYDNMGHIQQHKDLDILRNRADFATLVAGLAALPPKKPALSPRATAGRP